MNNPRLQEAINLVKQNGGNAEQVFYQLAKQKGVNPQEAYDKNIGTYGRFADAVKYIDPREE